MEQVYLCLGDKKLLEQIRSGKITTTRGFDDSQTRSARYLLRQGFISTTATFQVNKLKITDSGIARLKENDR